MSISPESFSGDHRHLPTPAALRYAMCHKPSGGRLNSAATTSAAPSGTRTSRPTPRSSIVRPNEKTDSTAAPRWPGGRPRPRARRAQTRCAGRRRRGRVARANARTSCHCASCWPIADGSRVQAIGGGAAGAGAAVVAGPVDRRAGQLGGRHLELRGEGDELGDATLRVGDLCGHEVVEAALHGPASIAVPDRHEVGDLLERAAQLLGVGDERQPIQRAVVVEAVARVCPGHGLHQPDALVVPERRG